MKFLYNLPTDTKIALTIALFFLVIVIGKLVIAILYNKVKSVKLYYKLKNAINYSMFLIIFIGVFVLWYGLIGDYSTYLGLFSAGLAIALKDLIINVVGWFFIIWRKPFDVGDRIEIGDTAGDVIDIRLFQFSVLEIGNWVDGEQSTGRVIHIPNYKIFNDKLANYTKGFDYIWNEIKVLITFESDWEKTKEILRKIIKDYSKNISEEAKVKVRNAAKKYMVYYNILTPTVYTSVKDNGIQLSVRYICSPKQRRNSEEVIWESILKIVKDEDDINFAYPTQRVFVDKDN